MARKIRFGVQTAPQNTTWSGLRAVWNVIDNAVAWAGMAAICGSASEKEALVTQRAKAWGRSKEEMGESSLVGSADDILKKMDQFQEAGVTHFITLMAAPFNADQVRRFSDSVVARYR